MAEHRVDDDGQLGLDGAPLTQHARDGEHGLRAAEHADLDGTYGQLCEDGAHLRLEHVWAHQLNGAERAAVLGCDAG